MGETQGGSGAPGAAAEHGRGAQGTFGVFIIVIGVLGRVSYTANLRPRPGASHSFIHSHIYCTMRFI